MAVKIPWKSLSKGNTFFSKWGPVSTKWGTFSAKQVAFFAAVGLVVIVGVVLRAGQYFGEPEAAQNAPVTIPAPTTPDAARPASAATGTPSAAPAPPAAAPAAGPAQSVPQVPAPAQETRTAPNEPAEPAGEVAEPAEQAGEAVEQAGQPELPGQGMILVSKRPIEVLSAPSATASIMYGFPAGRPFRVIAREGGFAQIKDLRSGASGWIDEAALAPAPRAPDVAAPSRSRPDTVNRTRAAGPADAKPKATKKDSQATADSEAAGEPAEARKRPGPFGRGGLFGGIFGGGN